MIANKAHFRLTKSFTVKTGGWMDGRKLRVLSKSCCHGSVPPPLGVKERLFVLLMRLCFLSY